MDTDSTMKYCYFFLYSTVGRPRLRVDLEDIEFLLGLRFSYTQIANILGVSQATLYRRLEEEGVSHDSKYTSITDIDLDRELVKIKLEHPK